MEVRVQVHDPEWSRSFKREVENLRDSWGDNLVAAHHVGSTAIASILAKPIVDVLVEVRSIGLLDPLVSKMEARGYQAMGEYGLPGRRYFRKYDQAGDRTHHIHAFEVGNSQIHRLLVFRDCLLAHPAIAQEYSSLKQRLAAAHPHDMRAYVEGKEPFIRDVEAKALVWGRTA